MCCFLPLRLNSAASSKMHPCAARCFAGRENARGSEEMVEPPRRLGLSSMDRGQPIHICSARNPAQQFSDAEEGIAPLSLFRQTFRTSPFCTLATHSQCPSVSEAQALSSLHTAFGRSQASRRALDRPELAVRYSPAYVWIAEGLPHSISRMQTLWRQEWRPISWRLLRARGRYRCRLSATEEY